LPKHCRTQGRGYFVAYCWSIWRGVNLSEYDDKRKNSAGLLHSTLDFISVSAVGFCKLDTKTLARPLPVAWRSVHVDVHVLNADGSQKVDGNFGVGVIVHKRDGSFIFAFAHHVNSFDPFSIEVKALLLGLKHYLSLAM
jgi:hypothetical protein